MILTRDELCKRIAEMHLDDIDIVVTAVRDGFLAEPVTGGPYVSDIGSSFEVPGSAGDKGRDRFISGPFDAWQYHASYIAPHPSNYESVLNDIAAGYIAKAQFGYGALEDTWVFGVRVFD